MTISNITSNPIRQPVTVSLTDLQAGKIPHSVLEEAFGPSSLGILIVSSLPTTFPALRRRVLSYSSHLAALPESQLVKLEAPSAKYLVGWSLGKEKLKSNKPDTLKGSYYVNCAFYRDPTLQSAPKKSPDGERTYEGFEEYTADNVWPDESILPGFKDACEELCRLIIDVASLVAAQCDRFAERNVAGYDPGYLERVVKTSLTTKARLLHYFPPPPSPPQSAQQSSENSREEREDDDWCATHVDHGCLTGLTSAMFIDETTRPSQIDAGKEERGEELLLEELASPPDPSAGLYIHARDGSTTKVSIPKDCLAFQTGEALELITKGKFRAVPHFVRGITPKSNDDKSQVARNTLAVFTQPNLWEQVTDEMDFAGFARSVVARQY